MPDELYDRDILAWSRRQADLLRRLAAGERVNDLDWPHVIDEVEDVGRSELRACASLLTRALEHLLKRHGWPGSDSVPHWRGAFRSESTTLRQPGSAIRLGVGPRRGSVRFVWLAG